MRNLFFVLILITGFFTMPNAEILFGEVRNAQVNWIEQTHTNFIMFQADCGVEGVRYFYFSESQRTFSAMLLSAINSGKTVTFWATDNTTLIYSFGNIHYNAYLVTRLRINN